MSKITIPLQKRLAGTTRFRRMHILWWALLVLLIQVSCGKQRTSGMKTGKADVEFQYARLIRITKGPGYRLATIKNPWDTTRVLHRYVLIARDSVVPASLPEGTVVKVPIDSAVVFTSVHCGLLQALGKLSAVQGICDASYVLMPQVREALANGCIRDLGNAMQPDVERIIAMHPQAVLVSPFENSGGYGRLDKTGLPLIECADYMEYTPLGRAEWMRFYGILFGCEAQADSLFKQVAANYNHIKTVARGAQEKPQAMADLLTGGVWYMPGGRSTMGCLMEDAGIAYIFADDKHAGSVPLSAETVLSAGRDVPLWFIKYYAPTPMTYARLEKDQPIYAQFRAWRSKGIYGCNTAKVPFFDEAPFHPDWLLGDFAAIAHPTLFPQVTPHYYTPLP